MSDLPVADLISQLVSFTATTIGHPWAWGGIPGPNFTGAVDCSSYCNYLWGVAAGQAIPGFGRAQYNGTTHGPSTIGWLDWQGQGVGSVDRSLASAGDLAVWRTHMGFCLSNTEMISAQTAATGVQRSGIDGFIAGEQLVILRLAVVGPGGITLPVPVIQGSQAIDRIARDVAQDARLLVAQRMRVRSIGTKRLSS